MKNSFIYSQGDFVRKNFKSFDLGELVDFFNMSVIYLFIINFYLLTFMVMSGFPLSKHGLTIIVSLDGFRYKYFDENITPTLTRLREEGSRVPYMINIFPTKTFPNHFAIVTGRYAEEHGVLDNKLFDPLLNKSLGYSEELFTSNKSTLPIWVSYQLFWYVIFCMSFIFPSP